MSCPETENSSQETPQNKQKFNQKSVLSYLTVLFAAAFCLLLLTYMMERRDNESEIVYLSEYMNYVITDKGSVEEQRDSLIAALATAEAELAHLEEDFQALQEEYDSYVQSTQAQLDEAFDAIAALEAAVATATQELENS